MIRGLFAVALITTIACKDDDRPHRNPDAGSPSGTIAGTPAGTPTGSTTTTPCQGATPAPFADPDWIPHTPSGSTGSGCRPGQTVTAFPTPTAAGVSPVTTVEVTFSEGYDDADLVLTGPGGPVPGDLYSHQDRLIFVPAAPLELLTTYDAELTWACGPTMFTFTTSDVGNPTLLRDLDGATFRADLSSGRFVEPAGVGSLIGGLMESDLLLHVASAQDCQLDAILGWGSASSQDPCEPTVELDPVDFSTNPWFAVTGPPESVPLNSLMFRSWDIRLRGGFRSDGEGIEGLALTLAMDMTPLADLLGSDPCALLVTFGVECEPCPDGLSDTCLPFHVDSIEATVASTEVVPRTPEEIQADPACP